MQLPPIEIQPYRSGWADEFAAIGAELRGALGDIALRIDHIGSTSVPGLAAKDRIDLQITVAGLDAESIRPAVEAIGYRWRNDITGDHCPPGMTLPADQLTKLCAQRSRPRDVNCHIRVDGSFNQRYALLFRDYLRTHPAAAAAYGELKRQLAARFTDDWDAYYDIKDPAIDMLMAGAEEWAARTTWEPGPSDA